MGTMFARTGWASGYTAKCCVGKASYEVATVRKTLYHRENTGQRGASTDRESYTADALEAPAQHGRR